MPIQLALAIPAVTDLSAAVAQAKLLGFAGLQFEVTGEGLVPDAPAAAALVKDAGLVVAALGTDICLHERDERVAQRAMAAARQAIAQAATLGAAVVRVWGYQVPRGEGPGAAITRIGRRLRELGQAAGDAGIKIAVGNGGSFVRAKELWMLCEVADHPAVGIAWDAVIGAQQGEGPVVAVPTLNTRIVLGQIWDAAAEAWDKPVTLGTGAAKAKVFIERLRGIGYGGWVTYSPRYAGTPSAEELAADRAAAAKVLRRWVGLPELGPDGQPVPPPKPEEKAKPATAVKPAAPAPTAPAPAAPGAANPA